MFWRIGLALALALVAACGETLPADIEGYQTAPTCVRLNKDPIPPYEGDPHKGIKNVFACNVDLPVLLANTRPFPDGTIIVKESRRPGVAYTWLVATARKQEGRWRWDEYTRNFDNEGHERVPVPQSKCMDCHAKAAAQDFIFTTYDPL
ncbi:MAG: hypothetical protein SF187_26005 [Deltaproteobacteria bacterium]|nr:hypothetical protein [Deltaproteobacteria bacterium]